MAKKKHFNPLLQPVVDLTSGMIQIPAAMVRANPMRDMGMSLGFETMEVTPEMRAMIQTLYTKYGVLIFREGQEAFDPEEIPKYDGKVLDEKYSPSEYLRIMVIFKRFKLAGGADENFSEYYRQEMWKIIKEYQRRHLPARGENDRR